MVCKNCGAMLREQDMFCSMCGEKVVREKHCPQCNEIVEEKAKFCWSCGASLDEAQNVKADDVVEASTEKQDNVVEASTEKQDAVTEPSTEKSDAPNRKTQIESGIVNLICRSIGACMDAYMAGDYSYVNNEGALTKEVYQCMHECFKALSIQEPYNWYNNTDWYTSLSEEELSVVRPVLTVFSQGLERELYVSRGGFEICNLSGKLSQGMRFLELMADKGYGEALYQLGRCYGLGRTFDKWESNLPNGLLPILPDFNKCLSYMMKAVEKNHPQAFLYSASILLEKREYEKAKGVLLLAKKNGVADADIYLRYIEKMQNGPVYKAKDAIAMWGSSMGGHRSAFMEKMSLNSHYVEHEGFFYFCGQENSDDSAGYISIPFILGKVELQSGKRQVLSKNIAISDRSIANGVPEFSISKDCIYYSRRSGNGIYALSLDGKDYGSVKNLSGDNIIFSNPIAFDDFLICCKEVGNSGAICRYDYKSEMLTELSDNSNCEIVAISEKEILFSDGTLLNIRTKEKTRLDKRYPIPKTAKVIYVDMAHEILYYEEAEGKKSQFNYRIIGIDTKGEVVDLWNMPILYQRTWEDIYVSESSYCSQCFNGNRMSGKYVGYKMNKLTEALEEDADEIGDEILGGYLVYYGRMGLPVQPVYHDVEQDEYSGFGAIHNMTDSLVIVLRQREEDGRYWITYVTDEGEAFDFDLFI